MRFLSPGFLFALFTIAIPIIIHLFNFRKFKKVYFSNVRFLKNIHIQTSSRRQLKDRMILLTRIAGIAFMVFAFSQPYLPATKQQNASQQQAVSIYIDNSYSMETLNEEGTLLDEAKRRAKEISSAYSVNDKFQLLSNDFEGKYQRFLSFDEFQLAVEELSTSSASRDLDQLIKRQEEVFLKAPNAKKNIYILSDFQKNILPAKSIKLDSSSTNRMVRLNANPLPNISIDSVWFTSAVHKPGDTEHLVVRLRNNSDEEALNIPVKLLINKQHKALGSMTIEPRRTAIDTLSFSGLSAGWQEGELEITDFPVVFDDHFHFAFNVREKLPILIVNGAEQNEYLNSVYRSDPYFKVTNTLSGHISYTELSAYSMIILNEVSSITEGLGQQLNRFVRGGGNLMVFPNLGSDHSALQRFLQLAGTDLPGQVISTETAVSVINLRHPVFKGVFDNIPQKMDLPLVKRYLRYSSLSNTSRQNLMELPGRIGFFSEYRVGGGKIYLSAVPLSTETSNFVRHSVFVPIMYQTALLSLQDQNLFYQLDVDRSIDLPKIFLNPNQILKLKKENFEVIPDLRQNENSSQLYIADQIKEKGNYHLFKNDSLISIIAFNDKGAESDMSYASDEQIRNVFPGQKLELLNASSGSLQNTIKSIDRGTALWKVCLILSLIFFAAEVFLIRFYKETQIKPLNN